MPQFDDPITTEDAYRLICTVAMDAQWQTAVHARIWLRVDSWYNERMLLTDGSYIYREPFVDGQLYHANITAKDVLNDLLGYSLNPYSDKFVVVKGGI